MIRIGIICPSEIANRRFLPALNQLPNFKFIGVAYANKLEWKMLLKKLLIMKEAKLNK